MKLVPYREYDPLVEMSRMLDNMHSLVDRSLAVDLPWRDQPGIYQLALDVTEDDDNVVVQTAIPGVSADDIDISVTDNVLTISAESEDRREEDGKGWHMREMRYGKFTRSVQLPAEVNIDQADAEVENGILTVTLPKTQPGPVQKIAVKAKKLLTGKKE